MLGRMIAAMENTTQAEGKSNEELGRLVICSHPEFPTKIPNIGVYLRQKSQSSGLRPNQDRTVAVRAL